MKTCLASLVLCAPILAVHPTEFLAKKAESRFYLDTANITGCAPTQRESYTRFYVNRPYNNDKQPTLIRQDFEVGTGCFEGYKPARISVFARPIDLKTGKSPDSVLWRFSTDGVTGAPSLYQSDIYEIEHPGCCASSTTRKYFSLRTGKQIGSSTSDMQEFEFQQAGRRFITAEDNTASSPFDTASEAAATLHFAGQDDMIQSVSVHLPKPVEEWMAAIRPDMGAVINRVYTAGKGEITLELRCRCDRPGIAAMLPFSATGFDLKTARIQGGEGVRLIEKRYDKPIPKKKPPN